MTGEPMHITSNKRNGAVRPSYQLSSEEYIVRTAICQKARARLKRYRTVKNQACRFSHYRVVLV